MVFCSGTGAVSFMVLSSILSASGGISLAYAAVYGGFPFLRAVSRRMVCSPHRAPLRLPYGRKNARTFSRKGGSAPVRQSFSSPSAITRSPMFLAGFVYPMFAAQLPLFCFVFAIYTPLLLLAIRHTSFIERLLILNPSRKISVFSNNVQRWISPVRLFQNPHDPNKSSSSVLSLDAAILNSAEILVKIGGYLVFYSILILVIGTILRFQPQSACFSLVHWRSRQDPVQSALPLHTHIHCICSCCCLLLRRLFRHVADKCSDPDTPILIGIRRQDDLLRRPAEFCRKLPDSPSAVSSLENCPRLPDSCRHGNPHRCSAFFHILNSFCFHQRFCTD